jgi:hypothetical protein
MNPYQLIGLPYRLGAEPEKHGAADCLSLSRAVLHWYGISIPPAQRSWYRRLRHRDYSVFEEQLSLWGVESKQLKVGTVGLSPGSAGSVGLITYFAEQPGWISFVGSEAKWSPIGALEVVRYYYPTK